MPNLPSASAILGPTPGILRTGSFSRKASTSPASRMNTPSGLLTSEQILARNLTGAAPTEQVSPPVAVRMAQRSEQTRPGRLP